MKVTVPHMREHRPLPFDPFAVQVKIIGMPIGARNAPDDGDGDGFYTAVPGGEDNVPMPVGLQQVDRLIEASFTDRGFRGQEYTYGDMEWEDADDTDTQDRIYTAYSEWASWEGNFRQRYVSAALMGLPVPPAEGYEMGMREVNDIIATGVSEGQPDWAIERAKEAVKYTTWMMDAVDSADPYELPLYRGLSNVAEDAELFSLKRGDSLTMPLSAFSPNPETARQFSENSPGLGGLSAIIILQPGAKGVPSGDGYEDYIELSPGNWQEVPSEVVTAGDFEVVKTEVVNGVWRVTLRHTGTYDGTNIMPHAVKAAKPMREMPPKIPRWVWKHLGGSLADQAKKPPKGRRKRRKGR